METNTELKDVNDLEDSFKNWVQDTGAELSTANSYWDRIKHWPYFSLVDNSSREIAGMINKRLEKDNQLTAIRQFIKFLYERYEADDVSAEEYQDLQFKKNSILSNIELKETAQTSDLDKDEIKRNFIRSADLVRLLRRVDSDRARLWYVLYEGGFRMGEVMRLSRSHIRPEYGDHGAVVVPSERSKSADDRMVEFHADVAVDILRGDAPVGDWEDQHGVYWEDVFWPDTYPQKEYYHLKKHASAAGIGHRTPHSFRHTRITDLVHSDEYSKDYVQRRAGHRNPSTTDLYTELVFDRQPVPLETYCRENEIDIIEVLNDD